MTTYAKRAYQASSAQRSLREQDADVFRRANGTLRAAKDAGPVERLRAMADNGRLWTTVSGLLQDPANPLPAPLRASIASIGQAVQREMAQAEADFDFLIAVNENVAAGLSAGP